MCEISKSEAKKVVTELELDMNSLYRKVRNMLEEIAEMQVRIAVLKSKVFE